MLKLLDRAKAAANKVVTHKAYHLSHDWAGIGSIVVTFLDAHGLGQIVIGIVIVFAVVDLLYGEPVKLE